MSSNFKEHESLNFMKIGCKVHACIRISVCDANIVSISKLLLIRP